MKRLTKKVRNEIYKKALIDIERLGASFGICYSLYNCRKINGYNYPDAFIKLKQYKEIYSHKPKKIRNGMFWFGLNEYGHKKRISILKKAIKLTNTKKLAK